MRSRQRGRTEQPAQVGEAEESRSLVLAEACQVTSRCVPSVIFTLLSSLWSGCNRFFLDLSRWNSSASIRSAPFSKNGCTHWQGFFLFFFFIKDQFSLV